MARDLNRWEGIGRVGSDPEVKYLPNGTAVASLSIACGDDYKTKEGEKVERTEWVRLSAFGKLAEIIGQYVKKGSRIYVEGKFTTRQWEKDGAKHYSTEIVLSNMQMLDSKPQEQQAGSNATNQGSQQRQYQAPPAPPMPDKYNDFDDDIPF